MCLSTNTLVPAIAIPILFPKPILPNDDRLSVVQEGPLPLQVRPVFFVLRLNGSLILMCGHSFSGNLSNLGDSDMCTFVFADTASLASPAKPRNLEIVSRNLAAAI